jgi:N-acetylglutamate synthase-like GNAT family acetyltransferase
METKTLTDVRIRLATEADIEAIAALIARYVEEGKLLDRTFDELEELLPSMFVAEADGHIVGCAALEIYSRKLAEIRSLAVDKSAQGLGIGRKLVEACVELAREKNVFEVMAITSTEKFFVSCGFDFSLPGLRKALFIQTRDEL